MASAQIYEVEVKPLWIITTTIVGLLFIGLGYSQREVLLEKPEKISEVGETSQHSVLTTLEVRGIGEKRANELKNVGINTLEDLADASPKKLANKLNVSPKITKRWITEAKKLITNN